MSFNKLSVISNDSIKEKQVQIHEDRLVNTRGTIPIRDSNPLSKKIMITDRFEGDFAGKAFYLSELYDWEFGVDNKGTLILVPLQKF
jgi:hypothetical protein